MTDAERLRSIEVIIDQGKPLPTGELEQLSVGGQLALEARLRNELEQIAGELGPEGIDAAIKHLEGLLGELVVGGAPGEIVSDMWQTIERLRRRRAQHN